jgi:hypothetical protein
MTLAQSRQLLLNGNKSILLIVFLQVVFFSCKAKPPQKSNDSTEITPIVVDTSSISSKIKSIEKSILENEKKRISDSITHALIQNEDFQSIIETSKPQTEPLKDTISESQNNHTFIAPKPSGEFLNIALLLPFNNAQVPLNYSLFNIDTNKVLDDRTKMALEYYHGFKMAYNYHKKLGLKANIFVLDDNNNENKLNQLLFDRPFPYVDVIVGPVYNKNLKIMADYAKKYNIPIVSPLSSATYNTNNNPYYFIANTPNEGYFKYSADFIAKEFPNIPIDIIYDPSDSLGNIALEFFEKQLALRKIPFKIGKTDSIINWYNVTDGIERVVIIPSYKESFAKYITGRLEDEKLKLHIIGMQTWSKMKGLDFGDNYPHNVYVTSGSYIQNKSTLEQINNKYESLYHRSATDYVYQGYDLFNYLFSLYRNHDLYNAEPSSTLLNNSIMYNYNFIPMKNNLEGISYYYNGEINLLKLGTFGFTKVR